MFAWRSFAILYDVAFSLADHRRLSECQALGFHPNADIRRDADA
jgi:hypothetical protein